MYNATQTLVKAIETRPLGPEKRGLSYKAWKKLHKKRGGPVPTAFFTDKREYYREVYLKSQHWADLKARKLAINPICESCGSSERIDVHHLNYRNLYDVLLSDLKTVCRKCHKTTHRKNNRRSSKLKKKQTHFKQRRIGLLSHIRRAFEKQRKEELKRAKWLRKQAWLRKYRPSPFSRTLFSL